MGRVVIEVCAIYSGSLGSRRRWSFEMRERRSDSVQQKENTTFERLLFSRSRARDGTMHTHYVPGLMLDTCLEGVRVGPTAASGIAHAYFVDITTASTVTWPSCGVDFSNARSIGFIRAFYRYRRQYTRRRDVERHF